MNNVSENSLSAGAVSFLIYTLKLALLVGFLAAFFLWGLPALKAIPSGQSSDEGRYAIASRGDSAVRIDTKTGETWIMPKNSSTWQSIGQNEAPKPKSYVERFQDELAKLKEKQRQNREATAFRKRISGLTPEQRKDAIYYLETEKLYNSRGTSIMPSSIPSDKWAEMSPEERAIWLALNPGWNDSK